MQIKKENKFFCKDKQRLWNEAEFKVAAREYCSMSLNLCYRL